MGKQRESSRQRQLPTLLFLLTILLALSKTNSFDATLVDNVLQSVHACRANTNPALAVAVVQDGSVLLSRGYGVTSVGGNKQVSETTRFNIASLSKAFTATLLLKIMEEDGRYNLSTKVRDIMGQDFRFEDELRTEEATVEDLLSHKMAVPANNRLRFNSNLTRSNLKDRMQYMKSVDGFRNVYIYSNLMYGLATRMTEIIGNARWEELVRRHLYEPLNMTRSTFTRSESFDDSDTALPYRGYRGSLKPVSLQLPHQWSELAGSGAVVSTAKDMAEWLKFHLSRGKTPSGSIIVPEKTMRELYKARTAIGSPLLTYFRRPDVPVTLSYDVYAMGFRRGYYRGYPIVGHSGSTYGYRSLLTLIPSKNLGVFTTMSGGDISYVLRGTLHAFLLDSALNTPSWLNASTMCSFPEPWRNLSASSPLPYDGGKALSYNTSAYLGLYHNDAYGTLEVRKWRNGGDAGQDPAAKLTIFYGFATWDLLPLTDSSAPEEAFYGKGRNITAWVDYSPFLFHAPPTGSDVIVKLSAPGLEKKVPPVFTRVGFETSRGHVFSLNFLLIFLSVCSFVQVSSIST